MTSAGAPLSEDVNPALCKLSPAAAQYVKIRMEQEMLAIDRERDRLLKAMNDEILHMKQRLLYDLCSKMQDIAVADESNLAIYKNLCPDLIGNSNQKTTRKRMWKKPRLQKVPLTIAAIEQPIDHEDIIFDLSGCSIPEPVYSSSISGSGIMTTDGGQKWIVKVKKLDDNLHKIEYCDGSSSLVSDSDLKTLNLRFQPFDKVCFK